MRKFTNDKSQTAKKVHELGLSEVARIRAQMDAILKANGFTGSFEEWTNRLRADVRYQFATEQELLGTCY